MRALALLALLAASCSFDPSGVATSNDADPNAPDSDTRAADADPNAPDAACAGWSAEHFDACNIPSPTGALALGGGDYVYDTDLPGFTTNPDNVAEPAATIVEQTGQDARLISVSSVNLQSGSSLRVVGSLALIIAATGAIGIGGTLDVSSTAGDRGAGGDQPLCSSHAPSPGLPGDSGASGGGGAGFGAAGGTGGVGDDNGQDHPGGPGGTSAAAAPIVRGGCQGATGGDGDAGDGGPGGFGGGAIQLTSQARVDITGVVVAGGAGGSGSPISSRAGGGGGGSGGYIGIDAPAITIDGGVFAASGCGGGEGADSGGAGTPQDGADSLASDVRAAGGSTGPVSGGNGGLGGALGNDNGNAGLTSPGGGGGGGGGCGHILIWSGDYREQGTFTVSPAAKLTSK